MENEDIRHLLSRIKQHENIVQQLMKIIAATNNRMKQIEKRQKEIEQLIPQYDK